VKARYSATDLPVTRRRAENYRRYSDGGFLSKLETRRAGKKVAIRWHQPRSWRVVIRAVDPVNPGGL